jgi:protein phosphatase
LIQGLLIEVEKLFESEPTLLRLRTPLKIFGDLHGQLLDLNKLFDLFEAPTDEPKIGDIESTDYLFLGDYVDRGTRSLETILLLFALKLKYPENIHMLRGAHEDRKINRFMGLGDECMTKLRQDLDDPDSIFQRLNRIFEKMPIAALVEKNIFCVHGGIGATLENINELEAIQRPI